MAMAGITRFFFVVSYIMLQRARSTDRMLLQAETSISRTGKDNRTLKRELQRARCIKQIMSQAVSSIFRTEKDIKATKREPALRSNAVKDRDQSLA